MLHRIENEMKWNGKIGESNRKNTVDRSIVRGCIETYDRRRIVLGFWAMYCVFYAQAYGLGQPYDDYCMIGQRLCIEVNKRQ